ncbi:MAG: ATP-binding protein [Comamonadaceae bacterium]|nr:MAG: ATP-binding protein [Comamonadaceae bacterium]
MIVTIAVSNYRSINTLRLGLGPLNVITGPNGSGKSNLYRALRLLAEIAQGGIVNALAREGGMGSAIWAGPEEITARMRSGEVPVEGSARRRKSVRLQLGFAGEDLGYAVTLGYPAPSTSAFSLDPVIKQERIWSGPFLRPASTLVERDGAMVRVRNGRGWDIAASNLDLFESMLSRVSGLASGPEIMAVRDTLRSWRFYDHFRTDAAAPARTPQLGTRTPVLHHDGRDLGAALQTIIEIGDAGALHAAIADAFPGAHLAMEAAPDGRFGVRLEQHGLLRALSAAELSDGTLRYLLLTAALLSPRPPVLMVLNEPETSLHPDLLPALARLVINASRSSQVWVISHSSRLVAALSEHPQCHTVVLEKTFGETCVAGQAPLDQPAWYWPE